MTMPAGAYSTQAKRSMIKCLLSINNLPKPECKTGVFCCRYMARYCYRDDKHIMAVSLCGRIINALIGSEIARGAGHNNAYNKMIVFSEGKCMSGHSKWANIQHRKGRQDAKRGKIFTRLIKEITIAAKMGGGDPGANPRLRLAMDKATEANMPKDNIQRAIDKGTGNLEGVEYVELRYEGYGIGGAAIMVDCLTDNKTRTIADVRHAFNRNGGNLGTDGSVAFQFVHQGYLLFAPGVDEDKLMETALEAGAEDIVTQDDGSVEVITSPNDYHHVKEALEAAGFEVADGEVTMRAQNEIELSGQDAEKMQRLVDALEDLDDVQNVYTTAALDLE